MKLPFSLGLKKQEKKEYFLALLLRDEKVIAVVFEEHDNKIHVIGRGEEYFTTSLEKATGEEWLDLFDKAIAQAESPLPENVETQKTLYGVKETWVEDTKIKKDYLVKLKKTSDTLGLIPIGFIVLQEAIAHLLQQEEGAPVSAILLEVGQKDLQATAIRAGKVVEVVNNTIEESIAHSIDKLFHHFVNQEVLPSRIIILYSEHHQRLSQSLVSHTWSHTIPFLHVPKITTLPKDFEAKAVIFGAATQMGFEMLDEIINEVEQQKHQPIETFEEKEIPTHKLKTETSMPEDSLKTLTEDFGFTQNVDVTKKVQEETNNKHYSLDKDIDIDNLHKDTTNEDTIALENKQKISLRFLSFGKTIFSSMFHLLFSIKAVFHLFPKQSPKIPFGIGNKKILFIPPMIILFFIGIVAFYITSLKASIIVYAKPKVIEQNPTITFSLKGPLDFSKSIISAETQEITEQGKVSGEATGTKEVGTKAKGTITILSSVRKEQTLTEGIILTSSNGLEFEIAEKVKIASSSGLSNLITVKAPVTAKKIGKEYNLPSGTKFTITSYDTSDMEAKNDSAFSGGTKKEITVVSQKDLDKLLEELPKTLEEKAKKQLEEKTPDGSELLPFIFNTTVTKKEFDKEKDEESTTVTLSGTVTFTGVLYKKANLLDYAQLLLNEAAQGGNASQESISYEMKDLKKKTDNEILASFALQGFFLPKLETEKIAQDLTGKSFMQAEDMLKKLPQIEDVSITLSPNLPFLPSVLPRLPQNITVTLKKQ